MGLLHIFPGSIAPQVFARKSIFPFQKNFNSIIYPYPFFQFISLSYSKVAYYPILKPIKTTPTKTTTTEKITTTTEKTTTTTQNIEYVSCSPYGFTNSQSRI